MQTLERKIPPVALALLLGLAMWPLARLGPVWEPEPWLRLVLTNGLAISGGAIALAGVAGFRRAKTTVNPVRLEAASSLVTAGIYRITRNPMYLGILLVLLGWAAWLGGAWALAGPGVFVWYMNRFQITPEERVLTALFGQPYVDYCARVRRWL